MTKTSDFDFQLLNNTDQKGCTLGRWKPMCRINYYFDEAGVVRELVHSFFLKELGGLHPFGECWGKEINSADQAIALANLKNSEMTVPDHDRRPRTFKFQFHKTIGGFAPWVEVTITKDAQGYETGYRFRFWIQSSNGAIINATSRNDAIDKAYIQSGLSNGYEPPSSEPNDDPPWQPNETSDDQTPRPTRRSTDHPS